MRLWWWLLGERLVAYTYSPLAYPKGSALFGHRVTRVFFECNTSTGPSFEVWGRKVQEAPDA